MTFQSPISTLLIGIAFIGLVVIAAVASQRESAEQQLAVSLDNATRLVPLPSHPDFAGEALPMDDMEVRERLSKELQVNTYWQSNTLQLLQRSGRYFPVIESILRRKGIPEDFKYLAVAESGLDWVVSPAGATGMWQLMKATAQESGLEVNSDVDERYHLIKSTEAACDYLLAAHERFDSWTLAAASYNMGKAGLARQLSRQGEDSYYDLTLNAETKRYVFRIVALKTIMQRAKDYGFIMTADDYWLPLEQQYVTLDSAVVQWSDFAHDHGISYKTLKRFNPWLRSADLSNPLKHAYEIAMPVTENQGEQLPADHD